MFEGFESFDLPGEGATIHGVTGGSGLPLLLLHGNPQTHGMWHKVAPRLAADFTVVACDLRGYGRSSKPPGDPAHAAYSKRAMAADMVRVMEHLGEADAAATLEAAIETVLETPEARTRDLGSSADTRRCGDAIARAVR